MTTYNLNIDTINSSLAYFQADKYIYGSSRLGMLKDSVNVLGSAYTNTDTSNFIHTLGNKRYEFSNHLGNVLTVISDKPIPHDDGSGNVDYWQADIKSSQDYSPFGVILSGRTFTSSDGYRYGFNNMEKDDEVKGRGNSYDFGARMYDSRLGRWLSIDLFSGKYPNLNPYNFVANSPLIFIDPDGNVIKPAPGLSKEENERVESAKQALSKEKPEQYKYINELRYHPSNRTFLSKGDEGYDEAFDIIVHVTIGDLDNKPRQNEFDDYLRLGSKIKFANPDEHLDGTETKTSLWQTPKLDEVYVRYKDGNYDKVGMKTLEEARKLDEGILNGNIVRTSITGQIGITESTDGSPHVLITLDDFINNRSDSKVLSHEIGHTEGSIMYPHQTSMLSETSKGHDPGYEGGKIAVDRETKDRSVKQ